MLDAYSGATRVYVMVGHPIAQVRAPAGMTRLFEASGRDAIVVPFDVHPRDLDRFAATLAPLRNVDGVCVTVPHKFAMARHCATLSPTSRFLGCVNVIRRNGDGSWHGDMLDGPSQVGAFRAAGAAIEGRAALLVGAGGAGGAIAHALLEAGLTRLAVHDADPGRRDALLARLDASHPGRAAAGSADPAGFAIVANGTPMGMRADDPLPVDVAGLAPETFVGDVVTAPEITPLLAAARRLGCRTSTGVDMFEAGKRLMLDFWLAGARAGGWDG